MWTTAPVVAFALALAPAQPPTATFTLTNVRATHGGLGGPRAAGPFLPGDALYVAFDIDGAAPQPDGRFDYTIGMEVTDATNTTISKPEPAQKTDYVPLGGATVPAWAYYTIDPTLAAGEYTMTATITIGTASATAKKAFTVAPKALGVVRVHASADDRDQLPVGTTGTVGGVVFVQCAVVGFARSPERGDQPNLRVEMTPLDAAGRPTLGKPYVLAFDGGVDPTSPWVFLRFPLPLTRPGKFAVRLTATDAVANTTATFDLPVTVLPAGG